MCRNNVNNNNGLWIVTEAMKLKLLILGRKAMANLESI